MRLSVSAVHVRVPLVHPFTSACGTWSARDCWLVRLRDGESRAGVGEAALDPLAGEADLARLAERVRDVVRPGRLAASLADPDVLDAPGRAARAAVAGALVDGGWLGLGPADHGIKAAPVTHTRVRLPLNATIDAGDLETTMTEARAAVEAGFSTLKLKAPAGESVDRLVERVAGARSTCGPRVRLRLDANGAWSVEEAVARLAAIAPFGIEHVEQPVASLEEMVALRRRVGVPLAADELVSSPAAADAVLDAGAADVLVVKPARVGGPPVAAAIARHAAAHGVPVVVSNLLETGVGIMAALRVAAVVPTPSDGTEPRAHGLATADLLVDDLVVGLPVIQGGAVELPLPADLGRPDDEAIRRFAVDSAGDPW